MDRTIPIDATFLVFLLGMLAYRAVDVAAQKRKLDQGLHRASRADISEPIDWSHVVPPLFILRLISPWVSRARIRRAGHYAARVSFTARVARPIRRRGKASDEVRNFVSRYARVRALVEEYDFLMSLLLLVFFLGLGLALLLTENARSQEAVMVKTDGYLLTGANVAAALVVAGISYVYESFRLELERILP